MNSRPVFSGILGLALWGFSQVFPAGAALPKTLEFQPVPLETAGPGGAVAGLVFPGLPQGGFVIWPPATRLEGSGLPTGAAETASRVFLQGLADREPGIRTQFRVTPAGLALGVVLEKPDEARLLRLLGRLAAPGGLRHEDIQRLLTLEKRTLRQRWADPLEVGRKGALALLFPGLDGPWEKLPPPTALDDLQSEDVEAVWKAVCLGHVQMRVLGGAGLAERVASQFGPRIGTWEEPAPPPETGDLPASLALQHETPTLSPGNALGLVLGFRFEASEGAGHAQELLLMAEGLLAGEGSLRQRLDVALGKSVACGTEIIPVGRGEGALLLEMRVPRSGAAAAWRVLEGAVSSLRSMPLREDALSRARQRLDQASLASRSDPAKVLLEFVEGRPGIWPAELRWSRLPRAGEVRETAQRVLDSSRQAMVLAGPIPGALLETEVWRESRRIAWDQFDPTQDGLVRESEGGPPGEDEREAGKALAQTVFQALAGGKKTGIEPAFRAKYKAREETPFGSADLTLVVKGGPGGNGVTVEGDRWTVTAEQKEQGSEAMVSSPQEATFSLPQAGRLDSLVFREPVVLLGAVLSGQVPAAPSRSLCGDQPCPALRVELNDGTVLLLDLDSATHFPLELRVWWPGKDESRLPDQRVRYLAWTEDGGVRVASELTVEDALGSIRRMWLLEWQWEGSPAPSLEH